VVSLFSIMSPREKLAVLLVLGAAGTVYGSAGSIVVVGLLRRVLRRPAARRSALRRWLERGVLALAAVGVGCLAYAYFVEPYWPQVTHVRLASDRPPPGSGPVRIVQISDLHSEGTTRLEERLPDIVAAQRPDIIAFTGDALNDAAGLAAFRRCMSRLAKIAPTYAVRGNWDVNYFGDTNLFGGTGVVELDGQAVPLDINGAGLCIEGAAVGRPRRDLDELTAERRDAFTVLLYHYPGPITDVDGAGNVDLFLAGHTHGGQVALPFYGALVTLSRHGKCFEAGLYRLGHTWLYVNRGIGMEGGHLPRVRFFARPEVTLIELVGKGPK